MRPDARPRTPLAQCRILAGASLLALAEVLE